MIHVSTFRRNRDVRSSFGLRTTMPRAWPRRMIVAFEIRESSGEVAGRPTAWAASW